MNIIGKIIGLVIFVCIIFIIINVKTVLPRIESMLSKTSGAKNSSTLVSDAQGIGNNYVSNIYKDVQKVYAGNLTQTSYADFSSGVQYQSGLSNTQGKTVQGNISIQKINNSIFATLSDFSVPNTPVLHVWLSNTDTVTDKTSYIDMGIINQNKNQSLEVLLGDGDISLDVYKYIMIIDSKDYTIYGQSILGQ